MSATEISVFSLTNVDTQIRAFIIEANKNNEFVSSQINYSDRSYDLQSLRFNSQIKEIENYQFTLQAFTFTGITVPTRNTVTKTYKMRARKASDDSFIYWVSSNMDYYGLDSGFQINQLYDVCILAFN